MCVCVCVCVSVCLCVCDRVTVTVSCLCVKPRNTSLNSKLRRQSSFNCIPFLTVYDQSESSCRAAYGPFVATEKTFLCNKTARVVLQTWEKPSLLSVFSQEQAADRRTRAGYSRNPTPLSLALNISPHPRVNDSFAWSRPVQSWTVTVHRIKWDSPLSSCGVYLLVTVLCRLVLYWSVMCRLVLYWSQSCVDLYCTGHNPESSCSVVIPSFVVFTNYSPVSFCAVFITVVTSQYWEIERSTAQHLYKHYSECRLMFSRASLFLFYGQWTRSIGMHMNLTTCLLPPQMLIVTWQ